MQKQDLFDLDVQVKFANQVQDGFPLSEYGCTSGCPTYWQCPDFSYNRFC
ncbi:hypothetical protein [Brevibacillus porteri]